MEIDWKQLAQSPGYKSLKAAYTRDVQEARDRQRKFGRAMRDKDEFLRLFNWVICRAKHYAHVTGEPIEDFLNTWEEKRSYWWLNYYQDCRQPKLHRDILKPIGLNGVKSSLKKDSWYENDPVRLKERVRSAARFEQGKRSRSKKGRWSLERKKREAYWRERGIR